MRRFMPFFALLLLSGLAACRPTYESKRPYKVYPQDAAFFKTVVNTTPDSEENSITLKEDKYPIQIRLYEDGRFWYRLRKLGDGWGKWKYTESDGYVDLYAERTIFVMQMQLRNIDPANPKAFALEFSDRFGPKYLQLDTIKK